MPRSSTAPAGPQTDVTLVLENGLVRQMASALRRRRRGGGRLHGQVRRSGIINAHGHVGPCCAIRSCVSTRSTV